MNKKNLKSILAVLIIILILIFLVCIAINTNNKRFKKAMFVSVDKFPCENGRAQPKETV